METCLEANGDGSAAFRGVPRRIGVDVLMMVKDFD